MPQALISRAFFGHRTVVRVLLKNGADPNYLSRDGSYSPLILAAARNDAKLIQMLLKAGAKIDLRNKSGATALQYAADQGASDAVKALLAAGADPDRFDEKGLSPIHRASIDGHTDVVKKLIKAGGDVSLKTKKNAFGYTALHIAARYGHFELVNLLLKLGADVNAETTGFKQTPLHQAAIANVDSILLTLIEAGADVDHADADGDTPLLVAALFGNQESLKVLVNNGADKSLVNSHGNTARVALCHCTLVLPIPEPCQVEICYGSQKRMSNLLKP